MMRKKPLASGGKKFKYMGTMSCDACASRWKEALQKKGKHVRTRKAKDGIEVYSA